jgi:hypothetical protein
MGNSGRTLSAEGSGSYLGRRKKRDIRDTDLKILKRKGAFIAGNSQPSMLIWLMGKK